MGELKDRQQQETEDKPHSPMPDADGTCVCIFESSQHEGSCGGGLLCYYSHSSVGNGFDDP